MGCGKSVGLVPFSAKYLKFSRQRDPHGLTHGLTHAHSLAARELEELFFQLGCCVSFWFWQEIGFGFIYYVLMYLEYNTVVTLC
jgi:hypothetical protein